MFENVSWSFDISSFMLLLGEQEEANFRLMRRGWLECLTAAPVAGLQSYIRSEFNLCESTGPTYFSPYGQKHAPLRNMQLARSLAVCGVLQSSRLRVYRVKDRRDIKDRFDNIVRWLWLVFSWMALGGILLWLTCTAATWIGNANCIMFVCCSMILRLIDRQTLRQTRNHASFGQDPDAALILGPRNSCFVLEGSRAEVSEWTGLGVEPQSGGISVALRRFAKCLSVLVLICVFSTIPNGSFSDQTAFIALNLLAQLNVLVGQRLAARECMKHLSQVDEHICLTRTHVYGYLLKRYGTGSWVDAAGLLPSAPAWNLWRSRIMTSKEDVKALWESCVVELKQQETIGQTIEVAKCEAPVHAT